jgi:hypothetical protein
VFGITDNLNFGDLFEKSKSSRTRANHRDKLYVKMAKVNSYKYSFFVRIRDRAIFTKRQGRWKTGQGKNFFQSP